MLETFVYLKVTAMLAQIQTRAKLRTGAAILLAVSGLLPAQSVHPVTGRRIAPVMGIGGADWLERSERESEELPGKALDVIGVKPGMMVADIGAGVGYFVLRLAERIGPTGKVYANDIQPEMLAKLRRKLQADQIKNVEIILGKEADPLLPAGKLDLILMVDVYHELSQPQKMLAKIREALKPDGRLVLLEYRKEDPFVPIRPEHKMSIPEVRMEIEAEGFRLTEVKSDLPRQHIFIFKTNVM